MKQKTLKMTPLSTIVILDLIGDKYQLDLSYLMKYTKMEFADIKTIDNLISRIFGDDNQKGGLIKRRSVIEGFGKNFYKNVYTILSQIESSRRFKNRAVRISEIKKEISKI